MSDICLSACILVCLPSLSSCLPVCESIRLSIYLEISLLLPSAVHSQKPHPPSCGLEVSYPSMPISRTV